MHFSIKTLLCAIITVGLSTFANSHSGGLAENGGHVDRDTGQLHFHKNKRQNYIHSLPDDLATSNDESNDQPIGFFGTETVTACTPHNGRCYTLDADVRDDQIKKVFFPKGGHIRFTENNCTFETVCKTKGKHGKSWTIERRPSH